MRCLFFIPALLLLSAGVYGQQFRINGKTKADYERVFTRFMRFYNNTQSDSIYNILSDKMPADYKTSSWNPELIGHIKEAMGNIVSFKVIDTFGGMKDNFNNPMVYLKLVFDKPSMSRVPSIRDKKEHASCISLDDKGKILGLNFITSNPAVDSLISRY